MCFEGFLDREKYKLRFISEENSSRLHNQAIRINTRDKYENVCHKEACIPYQDAKIRNTYANF